MARRTEAGQAINGLYKAEVINRRGPWRSFEAVEFATLEWGDWFNNRLLMEPIGNILPAEAEERCYAMLDEHKLAARRKPESLRQTRRGSELVGLADSLEDDPTYAFMRPWTLYWLLTCTGDHSWPMPSSPRTCRSG